MKWQPYPGYRPSGVEWVGDIPEDWGVCPIKHLTRFINGAPFKPADWQDEGVPIIRIENLNGGEDFNYYKGFMSEKYHVNRGDLLFGWSGNRGTSFGPVLWWREGPHFLNQHIFRLIGYDCDKTWLYWTLKEVTFYVEKQAHGIIGLVHITKGDLGAIKIPIPSLSEQPIIAAFLDRETARIDALMEKKRRQIELLQEKRAALISHAVTKGLDRNIKMKNSGVEWLGHIPMHWEVKRLKNVCSLLRDGTHLPPPRTLTGIPLLSVRNIVDGKLVNLGDDSFISEEDFRKLNDSFLMKIDDVVLAIVGATIGKVAIVEQLQPFHIQRSLAIFRPKSDILHFEFLSYFLQGSHFQQLLWRYISFSAQPGIYLTTLSNFQFPVPPLPEQRDIIKSLSNNTEKINALIAKVQASIDKLKEYRTALISAAVTGQIDVREEAA